MGEIVGRVPVEVRAHAGSERFNLAIAITCAAIAILGFVPSYWLPATTGVQRQPPLVHLHAWLFSGWMLFFVLQASLISRGDPALHKRLGLAGIALAATMSCVGLLMTIHSLHVNAALGFASQGAAFSIVSFSGIVLFAGFVTVAIATRERELHKRLMLLVNVSLLQPAIGRLFLLLLQPPGASGPPPVEVTVVPGLVGDLFIVAAIFNDRRVRGRVHTAYWVGGAVIVATQLLRVPLSRTDTWLAFAAWLSSLSF